MGITDRKLREKEEMKTRILDAAKEIFLEKGYQQASMRNIADRIEYSPGTIYLYFKEKDEIFRELHNQGFYKLLEKMQPLSHVAEPFERLKAMGRVYMDFAFNNKDFYDLMFIMKAPMKTCDHREYWEMGCRAFDFLESVVKECLDKGRFGSKNVHYLSFTIWASLHGMCALYCRDRMHVIENTEPKDVLENGFRYFEQMLEKL